MSKLNKEKKSECCPKFNPAKWDEKTFNWNHKQFIKTTIPTFFHVPFSPVLGKKITRMMKTAEKSKNVAEDKEDVLLLFTDPHPFKSELYLSVTGKVPDAYNTNITGTFMSKVFDGPYNAIPKFIKQMEVYLSEQQKKSIKYYVHYAYCPKCAKNFGHNYMVLFAQIKE